MAAGGGGGCYHKDEWIIGYKDDFQLGVWEQGCGSGSGRAGLIELLDPYRAVEITL
jgi:hypothetical protein